MDADHVHADRYAAMKQRLVLCLVGFAAVAALAGFANKATIKSTCQGEVKILIDGMPSPGTGITGPVNDREYTISIGATELSDVSMPIDRMDDITDLIAFPTDTDMAVTAIQRPTTSSSGEVKITLSKAITVELKVWVLFTPRNDTFDSAQLRITDAINLANEMFGRERMGIKVRLVDIIDARSTPGADTLKRFFHGSCERPFPVESIIGTDPIRINVYLVSKVDNSPWCGYSCPPGFIAIAYRAPTDALAHELGHNFDLGHVDLPVDEHTFEAFNVMQPTSRSGRSDFTDGQTFRANLSDSSIVNIARYPWHSTGRDLRNCVQSGPLVPPLGLSLPGWDPTPP